MILLMAGALKLAKPSGLQDFRTLVERVRQTFVLGQQQIEALKVQTYWEAGRLIHEHIHLLLEEGHARWLDKVALGDWEAV